MRGVKKPRQCLLALLRASERMAWWLMWEGHPPQQDYRIERIARGMRGRLDTFLECGNIWVRWRGVR